MKAKIITGIAILGLSLSLVNTAEATELAKPIIPAQDSAISKVENPISPYNLQKYHETEYFYSKSKYKFATDTPNTLSVSWNEAQYTWAGTLKKLKVTSSGDNWKVVYGGNVTRY